MVTPESIALDTEGRLTLSPATFIGKSVSVLGITGSGKSNTVKHLLTNLLPHIPATICDVDGEYRWLKDRYGLLVVGQSKDADLAVAAEQAGQLAMFAVRHGLSIVLDMFKWRPQQVEEFLYFYCVGLWECLEEKRPYMLVLEEAQDIIPQGTTSELSELIIQIAKRGRKHNLSLWVISQRPASVDKNVLTQTPIRFLHRTTYPNDKAVYLGILPLDTKEAKTRIPKLAKGQAFVVIEDTVDIYQLPLSADGEAAIQGVPIDLPAHPALDATLLSQLREALGSTTAAPTDSESEGLKIARLRHDLEVAHRTIEEMRFCIQMQARQLEELTAQQQPALTGPRQLTFIEPEPADEPAVTGEYVTEKALQRRRSTQLKGQERRLAKLDSLSGLQKEMLALLWSNEAKSYTADEMAFRLGVMPKSMRNVIPHVVEDVGWYTRYKDEQAFKYQGTLRQALQQQCPDLKLDDLILEVISRLE